MSVVTPEDGERYFSVTSTAKAMKLMIDSVCVSLCRLRLLVFPLMLSPWCCLSRWIMNRRMMKNNGLKINNQVLTDESKIINVSDFDQDNNMKVSHGKKQHVIVKIV